MDLLNLTETEITQVQNDCLSKGSIFRSNKISDYTIKFFETVTLSNTLIKLWLLLSLSLYFLVNLIGNITVMVLDSYRMATNPLVNLGAVLIICFIVAAIFNNINTNQKKEENIIFVDHNNFVFNFNNGVTRTPDLFYRLPYTSCEKIEFLIHRMNKNQLFGSVAFTFRVADYTVTHTIRYTNLSRIEQFLQEKFPSLLAILVIDGRNKENCKLVKSKQKLLTVVLAFALLLGGVSLLVMSHLLSLPRVAISITGLLLIITAVMIFLASYCRMLFLVQGVIISCVFVIIGFCVPILIAELSKLPFKEFVLQNIQILMPPILGIIGLCLLVYQIIIIVGKIHYCLNRKHLPSR